VGAFCDRRVVCRVRSVAQRVVTAIILTGLKKLAEKTQTTLDDKLFPALEARLLRSFCSFGIFSALKVLKLSTSSGRRDRLRLERSPFHWCFSGVCLRAFSALIDHAHEIALQKNLSIAAFMPWIKKTLVVVFVTFGVLMVAQSLGADVKAFLAGLGIGGLASPRGAGHHCEPFWLHRGGHRSAVQGG